MQAAHPELELSRMGDHVVCTQEGHHPLSLDLGVLGRSFDGLPDSGRISLVNDLFRHFQKISQYVREQEYRDASWSLLNEHFLGSGDHDLAYETAQIATSLPNPSPHGWFNAVASCELSGHYNETVELARKAYTLFGTPKFASLLIREAAAFGSHEEAWSLFEQIERADSIELDAPSLHNLNSVGWNMLCQGQVEKAQRVFARCLRNEDDFHLLVNMGHCQLIKGDRKQAREYYALAKSRSDDFEQCYWNDAEELSEWKLDREIWEEGIKGL